MSIAIARRHPPREQPEKLPPCRFPLPPNLLEFSTRSISAIRQVSVEETPSPVLDIPESDDDRLLNAQQVAERLGVSERWVRDHTTRRSPKIRGVKLGMMMRYRRADVDLFMQKLDT
jgi:predicted DNA-binding transcriptional regulator AlpA